MLVFFISFRALWAQNRVRKFPTLGLQSGDFTQPPHPQCPLETAKCISKVVLLALGEFIILGNHFPLPWTITLPAKLISNLGLVKWLGNIKKLFRQGLRHLNEQNLPSSRCCRTPYSSINFLIIVECPLFTAPVSILSAVLVSDHAFFLSSIIETLLSIYSKIYKHHV